jgi:eukaryotic-like serine/threonine-protein kinase
MSETADRIESLFASAVALAPEERGAYLERECSGDPTLRDRLLALLRAHDRAGHVIDRPVNGDPDQTAGYAPTSEQPGTVIAGRYKLLEEIGEGGMGTVWAAEQTAPVRRKVALKLIKTGMDSRSVLARFEAERQALALMDHPNIAKVLDGGLTDSGRPYFVMEYVKGVPITEYCDATQLTVEERLNLFVQVCSALQHAHQKGIIHRDLKPSNILVAPYDDKPVPKVIDFGLAKAMHQSLTEKTLYTAHETVLGIPLYMSPEQAQLNNLDVDTRADIYSLGVLLYELLTGTTPLERKRFKEAAWDEIRRMIREEEPPRPSMRLSSTDTLPSLAVYRHTEPAKLKKLVRGELDWIVMKALEKDRTRRYETANGLARDIQRYLDDEVVEARPPSTGYRIGKFVRRYKVQVIAASMVLLALLAGIAGTTWGLVREARAKTRLAESLIRERKANADLAAANAKVKARYDLAVEAVKTFHTGVSEDFLLKEDKFKDLRNRLLKSAQEFYKKLSESFGRESDRESRRALAQSIFELAELTCKVGRSVDALAAHRAVLAEREALAAEPEAAIDTATKAEVGLSLTAIASLLSLTEQSDEALATYRRSESLLADLATSDPSARGPLTACRVELGYHLYTMGKSAEAMAVYKIALADQEAQAAAEHASNDVRHGLAQTLRHIGVLLMNMDKFAESEAELRAAQAIEQKLADDNAGIIKFRSSLAYNHYLVGALLARSHRPALAEYRAAIAIQQKLADDNPAVTAFSKVLAMSHNDSANELQSAGRSSEAEAETRRALAIFQKLAADNPAVPDFRSRVSETHRTLSRLLSEMGRSAEAEAAIRTAVAIQRKVVDDSPKDAAHRFLLALNYNSHGWHLSQTGRPSEAEPIYRESILILQRLADDDPKRSTYRYTSANGINNLTNALRRLGRPAEAREQCERAIAILEDMGQKNPGATAYRFTLAECYLSRSLIRRDLDDPVGAAADARRSAKLFDAHPSASGEDWFLSACASAALAGLAARDGSGVSAALAASEAEVAMARLQKAVAAGYRNREVYRSADALDSLRNRNDFKKLMAELEKNALPQLEKK